MEGMRSLLLPATAAVLAASMLPAVAGVDPPAESPAAASVYPVFNYPGAGAPDPAITTELTRLIDAAGPGSRIGAGYFVVQPDSPAVDALIRAKERGVAVRIVLDSGDGLGDIRNAFMDAAFDRLAQSLGTDTTADSFATQCALACISGGDASINHNKFVTLSQSGEATDVVFQSTANLRSDGSGDAAWNAAVITTGNASLHDEYEAYLEDLAARLEVPGDDYNAHRPPSQHGDATSYFFPRTDGTDTVSQALQSVDCSAQPTDVDVMAAYFTRPRVRNRLNDLAAAGCSVRVLARKDTITSEFCESLEPPIEVRLSPAPGQTDVAIHAKYLTVSGSFGGRTDVRAVWTGSHNLTRNALQNNDETFLLTDDAGLHAAFAANFDTIWTDPTMDPGCQTASATDIEAVEQEANTEVTPIVEPVTPPPPPPPPPPPLVKQIQTVAQPLPRRLTARRTELVSARTEQGRRLTTVAKCKVTGTGTKLKARPLCVIKRPRTSPALVLTVGGNKRLKVRLIQTAEGTSTLRALRRSRDYVYRAPRTRS
jgi:hypothetical protein